MGGQRCGDISNRNFSFRTFLIEEGNALANKFLGIKIKSLISRKAWRS
jgi:hypothetical protein